LDEAAFDINQAVVIKDDNLFLVAQRDGSMPVEGHHPFGLYYNDCRFLSGWEIEVLGERPRPLICSAASGDCAIHELTNNEFTLEHGRAVPPQALQIRIHRALTGGGRALEERITVKSFSAEPLQGELVLRMRSGFEPMMWLRGLAPDFKPKRAKANGNGTGNGLTVSVVGRDGVERKLMTACRPEPNSIQGQTLRWPLTLARGRARTIALRHVVADGEQVRAPAAPPLKPRRPAPVDATVGATRVTTNDELFNRIIERSFADLAMLRSRLRRDSYFAAGIPWYATVFGRDTLITSMQMLAYDQGIAEQTLRLLASNLGTSVDAARDEEPGKVLHEIRGGELANLGLLPFARYYGSIDSTPLFLCLLAEHADWAGDLALFRELSNEVDATLGWIDQWGDLDGDGLLEYARGGPDGLDNQGWKDSHDGIPDERGRSLTGPIAVAEAQGYAMRAKRRLARLFELSGQGHRASGLREEAIELRERIERFWLAHEGFYSMALDGRKRASRALGSNQGHLLWSLAVSPARAARTRDALMRPEMFCGWGIRTLASSEPSYNPVGYHSGSVWPHDTALTAFGLRKYGYDEDFTSIFEGMLEAASRFPDYRLPELFAGFARDEYEAPVPYPVACHPQAWAAGSIPYMLRAGLGLIPDGLSRRLRVVRPSLPHWLTRVEVSNLRIAGSRLDLKFERAGDAVALADVKIDGDVEVVLEISGSRAPDFGL
jgi:glycogen debranching enzyme